MPLAKRSSKQENAFTTNNTRPNQNKQPLESARTHFYVRFNKSNVAMHRQTFIFLLPHKITTVQQNTPTGTINQIKQSEKQSTQPLNQKQPKNKPSKQTRKTISSINRKINHKNYHNKQPTQSLKKTRSKQNITNNYEKMQCF